MKEAPLHLVVVGESFLDVDIDGYVARIAPDAPVPVLEEVRRLVRPGAAAHAAVWAARDVLPRHSVSIVTALADDADGHRIGHLLEADRVEVVDMGWSGSSTLKVRIRGNDQPLLRLDRGTTPGAAARPEAARPHLDAADAVLVSDYGRGILRDEKVRAGLRDAATRVPLVWDPHVHGAEPVAGATVVTPNLPELSHYAQMDQTPDVPAVRAAAASMRGRWDARAVAVTMAGRGALVVTEHEAKLLTPPVVRHVDACGAGDRFAAALASGLMLGNDLFDAADRAVRLAAAYVAADPAVRGVAPVGNDFDDRAAVSAVVASARESGMRVVATSGCFDIIHPGHARFLEEARALGDMLIVHLNSDDSVRRLKGAGRPLNPAADRAAVLRSLASVDAIVLFDEDTPSQTLRAIRPTCYVKGGDYKAEDLPELPVLHEIGAAVEVLRYWPGYSTTSLISSIR